MITVERQVAPVLRVTNQQGGGIEEGGTELAGPAFSPDGARLYFSSQRATTGGGPGPGITYEVRGPFRTTRPAAQAAASAPPAAPSPGVGAGQTGALAATGPDTRLAAAGLGLLGAAAVAARVARDAAAPEPSA